MKKEMLFCVAALAFSFTDPTPPAAVLAAFQQKFPQVTDVDWEKEQNGIWEAEFDQNNTEVSANFSTDGKWIETETDIKFAELPIPVQTALKGKKVKEAAKIQRADGSIIYEAEVKRKDLLFDAGGRQLN